MDTHSLGPTSASRRSLAIPLCLILIVRILGEGPISRAIPGHEDTPGKIEPEQRSYATSRAERALALCSGEAPLPSSGGAAYSARGSWSGREWSEGSTPGTYPWLAATPMIKAAAETTAAAAPSLRAPMP